MKRCMLVMLMVWWGWSGVVGQKNDYIWLSGYGSNDIIDSATYGFRYGNTVLNFNFSQVNIAYDSLSMNFDKTNTSYCNDDGNLLFYTNGIDIDNSSNSLINNGSGLNAGWLDEVWDPTIQTYGYRLWQGILALPDISNSNGYYLIHSYDDSIPGSQGEDIYCSKTLTTYLDMSANNGNGNVIYKNRAIIEGDLGEQLAAVRHGNGKYWWILVQQRNTNCFYRVL